MKKNTIAISLLILLIIMSIIIILNLKNKKKQEQDKIQPNIYYSLDDTAKIPLIENKAIATNARISWTSDCTGEIKKDGKKFSREENILLTEEGNYEITITSPTGKNKIAQILTIDKTPPDVEIEENGTKDGYIITFKDLEDIAVATLTKMDLITKKTIKEVNLIEEGLKQSIEIKEKGRYILKIEDKLGNSVTKKTKFEIK